MDKTLRDKIKSMVLKSKEILEKEITRILEGKYGIHKSGKIESIDNLKDLTFDEIDFRDEIETKFNYLVEGGIKKEEAIKKIIRETAYTILNRLAALRFMDENVIIQESVSEGLNSKGFSLFKKICNEIANNEDHYLFYLDLIYDDLSFEIPTLFNRFIIESRFRPPIKMFKQIIDLLNNVEIQEIWKYEETIGWIYQYFFSLEKDYIREHKKPRDLPKNSHELIAINQFYTPDYVVKFLVDNSLGRLWKEIHPESNIQNFCEYLVLNKEISPENSSLKQVNQIKLIDPACGSGHFLLYAFDVFKFIYEEAINNNWVEKDYNDVQEISRYIIQNNIYGLDIDKRAIQLTNLGLFLKMKRINKDLQFSTSNIAPIDTILLNSKEKNRLKEDLGNLDEINEFIDDIWGSLINSLELGSILRLDTVITNFISHRLKNTFIESLEPFLEPNSKLKSRDFWKRFREKLIEQVKKISQLQNKSKEDYIKSEFRKSLEFLDILVQRFDLVVMNPPYGYGTNYVHQYMKSRYPNSNSNILCAFIENWFNKLTDFGILATLVDNTFLVKSTYEDFRKKVLLEEKRLFLGADLGWGVLDGAQVATIGLCIRKNALDSSIFFDITNEGKKEEKLREIIEKNKISFDDSLIFEQSTKEFSTFPNSAIAYNIPNPILRILNKFPSLDPSAVHACQGLASANSPRFYRYFWEVSPEKLGKRKKWVSFANGGQYSPFFRPIIQVINWENNGEEIKNYKYPKGHKNEGNRKSVIRNEDYYFMEGLTWGKRGEILNLSYLTDDSIFSTEGQAMFPNNNDKLWSILGIVNSKLLQATINTYCGQHKYSGYVGLLPFRDSDTNMKTSIKDASFNIYNIKKEWYEGDQINPGFKEHWFLMEKAENFKALIQKILTQLKENEDLIKKTQNEIDNLVYNIYGIEKSEIPLVESEITNHPETVIWDDMRTNSREEKEKEMIESFISYSVGVLLKNWKNSLYENPELKGILIDDLGIKLDLIKLIQDLFISFFNRAYILEDLKVFIGKDLRAYLRSDFFTYHYKKYKKRPIFWQLTIPSKKYSIWINYHLLNKEYLLKIKNEIIEPKLKFEEGKLDNLSKEIMDAEGRNERSIIKHLSKEISEKQKVLEEIKEFRKNLIEIIDLDLPFDLDDGVSVNIAPFYKLIPWDEPKKILDKINDSEYEWSSLFKRLKKRGNI